MAGFFTGEPKTLWLNQPGDADRKMQLLADYSYTDWADKSWMTPAKYVIDGASIPRALWTLVGSPYCGLYRRASIVHDKACDDAVNDSAARKRADKMFYQACRDGGCSKRQAAILYIGVRIGANFSRAGLIEDESDIGPHLTETPIEREMQDALRQIGESEDVANASETDDADRLDAAVVVVGKRHFGAVGLVRGTAPIDWE